MSRRDSVARHRAPARRAARRAPGRTVVISSVVSDSHTWNLVYLDLLIRELGFETVNLGACVPDELLVAECLRLRPAMLVISSVNGHGYRDGLRVIRHLRSHRELGDIPMVIGGKLGISGGESQAHVSDLLAAGFDAVFDDRAPDVPFRDFVAALSANPGRPARAAVPSRHGGRP